MQNTTIGRRQGNRETLGAAFWLVAGLIVLIASGDALALLIAAAAVVTIFWGMISAVRQHVRNRAEPAPVTQLRAAPAAGRDLKSHSSQQPWLGTHAA